MPPIDFLPDAQRDFDESFHWYAERSKQAAVLFLDAVDAALSTIADDPQRFAAVDPLHHACPVKRFPFQIVYRIAAGRIVVVAVAHAKRRPNFWTKRHG
ncbi:MAG: type II toxin-antitoxin system RelE/ParE family toxin [Planctomycetaceae bacterium]|nr:type II toxin-antitoxin system RelE/ParE family toxin [Planctomycetaceae bacterium]